jgi:hypothetical protein
MHGQARRGRKTKAYVTWVGVKNRCNNPNDDKNYPYYGGRGIKVCARWDNFENFLADMGEPPSKSHTIERCNTNGDYEPSNCYWATRKEQSVNRSYCRVQPTFWPYIDWLYEHQGLTQQAIADQFGVDQVRISQILRRS